MTTWGSGLECLFLFKTICLNKNLCDINCSSKTKTICYYLVFVLRFCVEILQKPHLIDEKILFTTHLTISKADKLDTIICAKRKKINKNVYSICFTSG